MKKRIALSALFLMIAIQVFAAQNEQTEHPKIKLSNKNYELKYSTCTKKSTTCMNEYYRLKENGTNWSELVTIHYLGKQKDVLTYAKKLNSISPYSDDVMYHKGNDTALVSFLLPYKSKKKDMIEQNIFRIEKSPDSKGLMAVQYAVRHSMNTDEEKENVKYAIKNIQDKYLMKVANFKIPPMVWTQLQNW